MPTDLRPVPNTVDDDDQAKIWEHCVHGRLLPKMFFRKLWTKYVGRKLDPMRLVPAVNCDGLVVFDFDDPMLFGGGTVHAPDFLRVMLELRLGPFDRLCDFCAGTGYIGFSLLAKRYCKTLCCTDLDRRSIEAVKLTAASNGISDLVTTYVSDSLMDVPETEKWDMFVANAPNELPRDNADNDTRFTFDPEWKLHRHTYSRLKKYMRPGGYAMFLEMKYMSTAKAFEPMVEAGGGKIIAEIPAKDFRGREDDRYFVVTQW